MRTRLGVEELLELAQEGARRGHYGTFMARARELGSQLEDGAYRDGYLVGQKDKVTADKTQHKPLLNLNEDPYSPWGLYDSLTRLVNDGHWEPDAVLDVMHGWLKEQNTRDLMLHYVQQMVAECARAAQHGMPAEE